MTDIAYAAARGSARVQTAILAKAAIRGDAVELEQAMALGAQVNCPDLFGNTALKYAVKGGGEECARILLKAGADPNVHGKDAASPLLEALRAGRFALAGALLDAGADPNHASGGGFTPLMTAAKNGLEAAVKRLLAAGADARVADSSGMTALMWAAIGMDEAGASWVDLAAASDIDAVDENGCTALMFAVARGRESLAGTLLSMGADHLPVDIHGKDAAATAAHHGKAGCLVMLLERGLPGGSEMVAAFAAAARGNHGCLEILLAGADGRWPDGCDARDGDGRSLLMTAVETGDRRCVGLLLEGGADVSERDGEGRTALHLAIKGLPASAERLAGMLLSAGARACDRDDAGRTAGDLALAGGLTGLGGWLKAREEDELLEWWSGGVPARRAAPGL